MAAQNDIWKIVWNEEKANIGNTKVYTNIHIYIHTHIYVYAYTYTHMYIHIYFIWFMLYIQNPYRFSVTQKHIIDDMHNGIRFYVISIIYNMMYVLHIKYFYTVDCYV
jgi:hypothetical protein